MGERKRVVLIEEMWCGVLWLGREEKKKRKSSAGVECCRTKSGRGRGEK